MAEAEGDRERSEVSQKVSGEVLVGRCWGVESNLERLEVRPNEVAGVLGVCSHEESVLWKEQLFLEGRRISEGEL